MEFMAGYNKENLFEALRLRKKCRLGSVGGLKNLRPV